MDECWVFNGDTPRGITESENKDWELALRDR